MEIHKADHKDCGEIASIYNYYLGKSTMDLETKTNTYYKSILDHQDEREELWCASIESKIVAWGIIKKYSDREGYKYTAETSVYCHHEHLRKGYGTKMKIHLMQRCRDLNYHHLIARINSNNLVSINYNIKLGYSIVGEQKEIGFVNGEWKDITVMQCII